jgi:hypothetical protein
MVALMGNGTAGQSDEDLTNTAGKLKVPYGGLAFDATEKFLYVTDWSNNRVVRLDGRTGGTIGQVKTVFGAIAGATAPANNTTGNNDGNVTSAGTPTVNRCANPADVMIAGTSPNKYVYITCYSDHTIKRMKADFSGADSANYGKGYLFVGGLVGGVSAAAATDGPIGSTYGYARTAYPWSLDKDSSGNIYWTEGSQSGNLGGRLRVYNATGSTLQFFNGNTSSSYTSNRINAIEHTTVSIGSGKTGHAGTPSGGVDVTAYSSATAAVARLRVNGPTSVVTGSCVEYEHKL